MAYPEHKKETGHKKEKVDKEESERLRKFNEELRSRKAPQPKAK